MGNKHTSVVLAFCGLQPREEKGVSHPAREETRVVVDNDGMELEAGETRQYEIMHRTIRYEESARVFVKT